MKYGKVVIGSRSDLAANRPLLSFDSDSDEPAFGTVTVRNLDPHLFVLGSEAQALEVLRSTLRVAVVQRLLTREDALPAISGHYEILEEGLRFTPHFPFIPGLLYRAIFDPQSLCCSDLSGVATLEFSLPEPQSSLPTDVEHVFPSGNCLPENLLRFYVAFSNSMQRGRVETEITLLGPDGEPAPDVLYRAPVELWDRSMRYLTILLDPGRLKRGVGPNRELGPPLIAGKAYTLVIGAGMLDRSGRGLTGAAYKRFSVAEAVRENVAVEHWTIVPPAARSREPLALIFPRPLDWALLANTITITSSDGRPIDGRIAIDQYEKRWRFMPTWPWEPGSYEVVVGSSLEDVCGNSTFAAFDRPMRLGAIPHDPASRSISFHLAPEI